MLTRPGLPLPGSTNFDDLHPTWGNGRGYRMAVLALPFVAFCRDRWPLYQRFGAVSTGSARTGTEVALAALYDLASQWHTALTSASPAGLAWGLLSTRTEPHRTQAVRHINRLLDRQEADALLLRHKMGLPAPRAAQAMGLSEADFELLRRRALKKVTAHLGEYADVE